ncbi:MAG: 2Fe-2S iron-sulfur cluster-binding protein [Ignavibacteriales bacterium]
MIPTSLAGDLGQPVAVVEIQRCNPRTSNESRFDTYYVPYDPGLTVLDVLKRIYLTQDASLAFRHACDCSYCGVCGVKVNGRPVLACKTLMTQHMRIEPLKQSKVIRDLVIQQD